MLFGKTPEVLDALFRRRSSAGIERINVLRGAKVKKYLFFFAPVFTPGLVIIP